MRTISLSSRLQWAFRGTVLPGALATGDVDNDGCKEFVVGSVQGELAIFRGRGGCGSWRYSEDQIEPEYDCWDAVDRGEIPAHYPAPASEPASMRRQSTFNNLVQGLSSTHESLSVSDILHMFEGGGGDQASASQTGSSEDEADELQRDLSANQLDPESASHIKWEDALDIERDGRKPWIVAQKLGTISSVVVADICNCGHNSIVVVNGEGKCHVFDYPFKRRFHPDAAKRRRQNNHYRRFSQERFFKDGVVTDVRDLPADQSSSHRHSAHASQRQADLSCDLDRPLGRDPNNSGAGAGAGAGAASIADMKQSSSPHTKFASTPDQGSSVRLGNPRRRGHSNSVSTPAIHKHGSAAISETAQTLSPANVPGLTRMAASTAQLASGPVYTDVSRSYASGPNSHTYMASTARRSVSGVGGHPQESDNQEAALASGSDMALTSNLSSQRDPPLTILGKCEGRESAYRGTRRTSDAGRLPVSPATTRAQVGASQGKFSADTGSSGRRHYNVSDAGADSLSAAYGDADIDSDVDYTDALSDNGDIPLLSREEAADIENIWGANLGKKSGDWFPFVLDRPDMTFAIPTNVEHAIVADIDNNGLNELVLTATDGFVYIFRIESTVKHAVKPILSSLGVFSPIPTELPSVNMTGNGSPYLHMSAPRSPDASDLELSDFQKTSRPLGSSRADGRRAPGALVAGYSSKAPKPASTTAPGSAIPGAESDLDLVNHLLKSIKEVSSTPIDRRTESAVVSEVCVFPQLATTSEPDTQPTLDAHASDSCLDDAAQVQICPPREEAVQSTSPTSGRRRSSGHRMSLSSRMRESFGGIVAGYDASRRPASSYNQTAPPSINHSRAATADNSGHSTMTHSRLPSISDEASELGPGNSGINVDSSAGSASSHIHSNAYPELVSATSDVIRKTRPRQSSVCIGALGILQEMPERRSSDMEGNDARLCDIDEGTSLNALATRQSTSGIVDTHPEPDRSVTRAGDQGDTQPFADPFMLQRLIAGPGSRGHSRSGSHVKPIGPSSRGHSRRGSISSAAASRQQAPSINSLNVDYTRSNLSAHEGSIYNTTAGNVAEPLEVAVSARGSFSKPIYPLPARNADADDDSIASQVTERLTKLGFNPGERSTLRGECLAPELLPMDSSRQLAYALAPLEREVVSVLPPPRSIVDWSTTSADKVATWFLDNIPGNVSIINAPASAFGTPLAQRRLLDSDGSTECDCSSCDCSLYTSDSESSSSSELAADVPYAVLSNTRADGSSGQARPAPPAMGSTAAGVSGLTATYSGINLPQPLGLNTVIKEPEEPRVAESTEVDNSASNRPLGTAGGPDDKQHLLHDEAGSGHKLHLGTLPELGLVTASEKVQQYLILSKPGGRFVPIDMLHGTMLPTVDPPPIPLLSLTGGNNAHMMNVDISQSMDSLHMAESMGMSYQQFLGIDYAATYGSYMYQSPSWQSGSIPWSQHIPGATYSSTGALSKSPIVPGPAPSRSQPTRRLPIDAASPPAAGRSTEVVSISQFPSSESLNHAAANSAPRAHIEPSAALASADSRKSFASHGFASVFNSGAMGGPTSLSSNLRTKRSMQWGSGEGWRGQNFNTGQGPSPIYRGRHSSGAMTPELGGGGMGLGAGHHGRRNLGFAGLRGYIGHGTSRQRTSGGSTTNRRGDEGGPPTGYFTPLTSGQHSAHGLSTAALSQGGSGVGSSGIMPREPTAILSSSMANTPSLFNAPDRAGGSRMESMRRLAGGYGSTPSAANADLTPSMPPQPPLASASPQRGQQSTRYSPSMALWPSFKDGGVLGTIKDNDDANESAELPCNSSRRNSATAVGGGRVLSEPLPSLATGPTMPLPVRDMITPFSDEPAGRSYWMGTEPPSARSHSSLGTGTSIIHGLAEEDKEEEIEDAPQPMELDVATYMVGGVAAGKRMRRILSGPTDRARAVRDANGGDDGDAECEFELNELISLVTMDGMVRVFDPVRKVTHFFGLSSKDPVLGIWKVKMHEEVCNPSPLETMLQDGNIDVNQEFGIQLLSSTPAKRIYRRIGLSHRDLLNAANYSVYIEDRVMMVNQLENHQHKAARSRMKKLRSQVRLNYEMSGDRAMRSAVRRNEVSPGASRQSTLSRVAKYGLNGVRLRETPKYQRVGRAVRNFGTHIRDIAAGSSTQPSAAESSTAGPYVTSSALTDDDHLDVQPSEFTTPGMSLSPAARRLSAMPRVQNPTQQADPGHNQAGGRSNCAACSEDGAVFNASNHADVSVYGVASSAERPSRGNMHTSPFLSAPTDVKLASKSLGTDIAAALTGWYGENRDDYHRALRVCDHLVVSTWRGTTYFIDVGTVLDIAHYNELFKHNWAVRKAAVNEAAGAGGGCGASVSEGDGSNNFDTQSTTMSTIYGNLREFFDITGLLSRLRVNGSVIQFKFQDTVSAFLADTYAPATGGPNVPCIFYVDYKDRIWAYYHLDEIAEMDDVYGATWFRDEPDSLHTPASKARAAMSGIDTTSYDKPFSVADLAHRRVNMEPWMPLPSETAFSSLVSFVEPSYPYSTRTWRKRRTAGDNSAAENQGASSKSLPHAAGNSLDDGSACGFGGGRTFDSSDNSTPPFVEQNNANTSGKFHASYLPGPYLCPIWADINSVDLYDVGVCNLIELATPELLVFKDVFCKDLGIDSSMINEKVSLATIPGLANWVRNCLFTP
ncbi:hypothetical protein GGI20_000005 [Coemansia sp. BCRC 34301]|nr:hypothetical protein GGI20_000005 [Coemansia sp. BCRC 34301]